MCPIVGAIYNLVPPYIQSPILPAFFPLLSRVLIISPELPELYYHPFRVIPPEFAGITGIILAPVPSNSAGIRRNYRNSIITRSD